MLQFLHPLEMWESNGNHQDKADAFNLHWRLLKETHDREVTMLEQHNRMLLEQLHMLQKSSGDVDTHHCNLINGLLCTPLCGLLKSRGTLPDSLGVAGSQVASNSVLHKIDNREKQGIDSEPASFLSLECSGEDFSAPADTLELCINNSVLEEFSLHQDSLSNVRKLSASTSPGDDASMPNIRSSKASLLQRDSKQNSIAPGDQASMRNIRSSMASLLQRESTSSGDSMAHMTTHMAPIEKWGRLGLMALEASIDHLSTVHPTWLASNNLDKIFVSQSLAIRRVRSPKTLKILNRERSKSLSRARMWSTLRFWTKVPVVQPSSKFTVCWSLLSFMFCCHDVVLSPLRVFDIIQAQEYTFVANWILAIFWTLDVLISISTGYYTVEGNLEMHRKEIIKKYAKSWMPLDIPFLTLDWFLLSFEGNHAIMGRVSKVTRVARMVRLLRVIKLGARIRLFMGAFCSEAMRTFLSILQYLLIIVLINHYISCVVFATWHDLPGDNDAGRYFLALHWSLSHSALGSMDLVPSNVFERIFASVTLLLSMVLFSTFLSSITNAMQHLRDLHARRVLQESMVREYFSDNKIPQELASHVWHFIWQNALTERYRLRIDDVEVFNLLPDSLIAQIKYETFSPLLVVHPIFQVCSELEPGVTKRLCANAIEQVVLRPTEELFWQSQEQVNRMIFVIAGSIVYSPDDLEETFLVTKGQWACEECMWARHAVLSGSLSGGSGGADLMLVVPTLFQEAIKPIPKLVLYFVTYAETFVSKFNEACADKSHTDMLFHDAELIQNLAQRSYDHVLSNLQRASQA